MNLLPFELVSHIRSFLCFRDEAVFSSTSKLNRKSEMGTRDRGELWFILLSKYKNKGKMDKEQFRVSVLCWLMRHENSVSLVSIYLNSGAVRYSNRHIQQIDTRAATVRDDKSSGPGALDPFVLFLSWCHFSLGQKSHSYFTTLWRAVYTPILLSDKWLSELLRVACIYFNTKFLVDLCYNLRGTAVGARPWNSLVKVCAEYDNEDLASALKVKDGQ